MNILAIETSCDETSIALLKTAGTNHAPKYTVLENFVSSQIAIHRPFGGVVPNLAKREHLKNLPILYEKILNSPTFVKTSTGKEFPISNELKNSKLKNQSKFNITNSKFVPDLIAVTVGPGLEPALWTGIGFVKEIYKKLKIKNKKIKLVGANHLEGHLYSFLLPHKTKDQKTITNNIKLFPAIALIVSGGHTILLKMDSLYHVHKLGETVDDAVGEAFDKVARMLNLPYPGGPEIEKSAQKGSSHAIPFPRPLMHEKNFRFSFSGLKTAVLYYLRDHPKANMNDVAASFQEAACETLIKKTIRAAEHYCARSVMLSGGVAANKALRTQLESASKKIGARFFAPAMEYNTDNAAMIGVAGHIAYLQKKKYPMKANGNLNL